MEVSALTIFNIETKLPILTTSVTTNKSDTHGVRLFTIECHFMQFINQYPPQEIAIERGFGRFNTSTQVIYRVHGLINRLFKDYEQHYYPPKKVKEVATGNGSASKKNVKTYMQELYGLNFLNDDESDSCAVGYTHLHTPIKKTAKKPKK